MSLADDPWGTVPREQTAKQKSLIVAWLVCEMMGQQAPELSDYFRRRLSLERLDGTYQQK